MAALVDLRLCRARLSRAWRRHCCYSRQAACSQVRHVQSFEDVFSSRCVSDLLAEFDQRREARECMVIAGALCVSYMQDNG